MTRTERRGHRVVALLGAMAVIGTAAAPQQTRTSSEAAELRIRSALRAFYFSLARHDWEALTAGILPAKVVVHHPTPAGIVAASQPHQRPANCSPTIAERVKDAEITIDAGWAAATVAWCGAGEIDSGEVGANKVGADDVEADEFRFIEFDGRWWIVHIELSHDAGAVRLAR